MNIFSSTKIINLKKYKQLIQHSNVLFMVVRGRTDLVFIGLTELLSIRSRLTYFKR